MLKWTHYRTSPTTITRSHFISTLAPIFTSLETVTRRPDFDALSILPGIGVTTETTTDWSAANRVRFDGRASRSKSANAGLYSKIKYFSGTLDAKKLGRNRVRLAVQTRRATCVASGRWLQEWALSVSQCTQPVRQPVKTPGPCWRWRRAPLLEKHCGLVSDLPGATFPRMPPARLFRPG